MGEFRGRNREENAKNTDLETTRQTPVWNCKRPFATVQGHSERPFIRMNGHALFTENRQKVSPDPNAHLSMANARFQRGNARFIRENARFQQTEFRQKPGSGENARSSHTKRPFGLPEQQNAHFSPQTPIPIQRTQNHDPNTTPTRT